MNLSEKDVNLLLAGIPLMTNGIMMDKFIEFAYRVLPLIRHVCEIEEENATLKEQLRWRKYPEEKPRTLLEIFGGTRFAADVIVCAKYDCVTSAPLIQPKDGEEFFMDKRGDRIEGVTFWMPFPEPPER